MKVKLEAVTGIHSDKKIIWFYSDMPLRVHDRMREFYLQKEPGWYMFYHWESQYPILVHIKDNAHVAQLAEAVDSKSSLVSVQI